MQSSGYVYLLNETNLVGDSGTFNKLLVQGDDTEEVKFTSADGTTTFFNLDSDNSIMTLSPSSTVITGANLNVSAPSTFSSTFKLSGIPNSVESNVLFYDSVSKEISYGLGLSEFSDALFRVYNSSDNTKKIALDCSLIANATTRILTLPDSNCIPISKSGTTLTYDSNSITNNQMYGQISIGTSTLATNTIVGGTLTVNGSSTDILSSSVKLSGISSSSTANILYYDSSSKLVTYAALPSTFPDNLFRIYDNSDNTKILAFELSAQGTGSTKTINTINHDSILTAYANSNLLAGRTTYPLTSGDFNTCFGQQSLIGLASGARNSAFGYRSNASGSSSDNSCFGYQAGYSLTSGQQNTFVGSGAGVSCVSGSNNIAIGYGADIGAGVSNTCNIGNSSIANTYLYGSVGVNVSSLTLNRQMQISSTITAIGGAAYGLIMTGSTYTTAANSDSIYQLRTSTSTISTAHTGVNFYNMFAANSLVSKSGAGTIANAYGIYSTAFSSLATNQYGLYVEAPTGGTHNYSAYFGPVIGINTSTPDTGSMLNLGGTFTNNNGGYQEGILLSATLNPAGGASGDVRALSSQPTIIAPNATTINRAMAIFVYNYLGSNIGTISNAYGIYVDASYTAGTVTNNYGLYVNRPNGGTNKYTAYFDKYVGIGVVPSYVFHVQGDALGTTSGNSSIISRYTTAAVGNQVSLEFQKYRTAGGSDHSTEETRLRRIVDVSYMGFLGFGSNYAKLNGNGGSGIYIDSNEYVGIGNTAPNCQLDIGDVRLNGTNVYELHLGRSDAAATIRVGQAASNNMYFGWSYNATASSAYGAIGCYGGSNNIAIQEGGGYVSIGSTNFNAKLDVEGTHTGTVPCGIYLNPTLNNSSGGTSISQYIEGTLSGSAISVYAGLYSFPFYGGVTTTTSYAVYCTTPNFGTTKWAFYANGDSKWSGTITPSANKTYNIGTTSLRWNNAYIAAVTTGTSRLCKAMSNCDTCNVPMKRGTGTVFILGSDADYHTIFCPECKCSKIEKICHLPNEALASIQPPTEMKLVQIEVQQLSGNSRAIYLKFDYGLEKCPCPLGTLDENGQIKMVPVDDGEIHHDSEGKIRPNTEQDCKRIINTTYLSDVEYAEFQALSGIESLPLRRQFIYDLGMKEWEALEKVRLMKQHVTDTQSVVDSLCVDIQGRDLMPR